MKHLHYLYILLLVVLGATNLQGQTIEDGEAFYIYRNDGDFDGFFYDQVQEMRYSKVALDGTELDDYVVYEVVTPDSIYRIPLAAIDSVGFVQPEIEFNPKVHHMDMLGMTPYITAVDGLTLTFQSSLPSSLTPKEGDVLLGFTGLLEENGFGGRVTNVSQTGANVVVTCKALEKMSDIFKKFVSVEEVGADEQGNMTVRRLAGYKSLQSAAKRASGSNTSTLIDANLTGRIKLFPDGYPIHANVDLSLALKVRLAMVYQIESDISFIKAMMAEDYSIQAGLDLGVDGSDFKTVPIVPEFSVKFPSICPLLELRPVPYFGVKWNADISLKMKFPSLSGSLRQTFVIDAEGSEIIRYQGNENEKQSNSNWYDLFGDFGAGFKFNGSLQLGLKHRLGLFSNSWIKAFFNVGMGVDLMVGPKLEANIDFGFNIAELSDAAYMLRNNKLAGSLLSLDYEAFGEYYFISTGKLEKYTFADGNFSILPKWELCLFPTLNLTKAVYNKDTGMINTEIETNECRVFWSSDIGLALMDKDFKQYFWQDNLASLKFGDKINYYLPKNFSGKSYTPGNYNVVPTIDAAVFGKFPIKSQAGNVTIPVWLEVPKTPVHAPANGGQITIPAETNGQLNNTNVIDLNPNESFGPKQHSIIVTASYPECEPESKEVIVNQDGGGSMYDKIVMGINDHLELTLTRNSNGELEDLPCQVQGNGTTATVSGNWSSSNTLPDGYEGHPYTETRNGYFTINLSKDEEKSANKGRDVYKVTGGNIHAFLSLNTTYYGVVDYYDEQYIDEDGFPKTRQILVYGTVVMTDSQTSDIDLTGGSLNESLNNYGGLSGNCKHKRTISDNRFGGGSNTQNFEHETSGTFKLNFNP